MPKQENLAQLNMKSDGLLLVKDFNDSAIPERFVQVCKSFKYDIQELFDKKMIKDLFAGYFVGLAKYMYEKRVKEDIRPLLIMNGKEPVLLVDYGVRYRYNQNIDLIAKLRQEQEDEIFIRPDEPVEVEPEPVEPPKAPSGVPYRFRGNWIPDETYDNNEYHIDVVEFHKNYYICKVPHTSNIDDRIDDRLLGGPFLRQDVWQESKEVNEAWEVEYTAPEKTFNDTVTYTVRPIIEDPNDTTKYEILTPSNRVAHECINKACAFRSGINIVTGFFMNDFIIAAVRSIILGMDLETKVDKVVVIQIPNVVEFIVYYRSDVRVRGDLTVYIRSLEECDIDQVKPIISIHNDDPTDKGY